MEVEATTNSSSKSTRIRIIIKPVLSDLVVAIIVSLGETDRLYPTRSSIAKCCDRMQHRCSVVHPHPHHTQLRYTNKFFSGLHSDSAPPRAELLHFAETERRFLDGTQVQLACAEQRNLSDLEETVGAWDPQVRKSGELQLVDDLSCTFLHRLV